MKSHTTVGADILHGLPFSNEEPLLKTAYEIARWHHERYDGRGYPDGLTGEEIPIAAQVVSVADSVRRADKRALLQSPRMTTRPPCG